MHQVGITMNLDKTRRANYFHELHLQHNGTSTNIRSKSLHWAVSPSLSFPSVSQLQVTANSAVTPNVGTTINIHLIVTNILKITLPEIVLTETEMLMVGYDICKQQLYSNSYQSLSK